jgi:hypothetical protein
LRFQFSSDIVIASASEAIQCNKQKLDCFVAALLAMTRKVQAQGKSRRPVYRRRLFMIEMP